MLKDGYKVAVPVVDWPRYNRNGGLGVKHQVTYLPMVEFMCLVFICTAGESYCRRFGSSCDIFPGLINSLFFIYSTQVLLFRITTDQKQNVSASVSHWRFLYWECFLRLSLCTFTRMPGERDRGRLGSLLLCLCDVFRALVNCLVCWFLHIITIFGFDVFAVYCVVCRNNEPAFYSVYRRRHRPLLLCLCDVFRALSK